MRPLRWLKTLFAIVRHYEAEQKDRFALGSKVDEHDLKLKELVQLIRSRTEIHADLSPTRHDPNTVIVIGRYRGGDFIQTYQLHSGDLVTMVDQLREMERYGHLGRVDAPPVLKAFVGRDHRLREF